MVLEPNELSWVLREGCICFRWNGCWWSLCNQRKRDALLLHEVVAIVNERGAVCCLKRVVCCLKLLKPVCKEEERRKPSEGQLYAARPTLLLAWPAWRQLVQRSEPVSLHGSRRGVLKDNECRQPSTLLDCYHCLPVKPSACKLQTLLRHCWLVKRTLPALPPLTARSWLVCWSPAEMNGWISKTSAPEPDSLRGLWQSLQGSVMPLRVAREIEEGLQSLAFFSPEEFDQQK